MSRNGNAGLFFNSSPVLHGPRRLYDTHESDIVRSQFIKSDLKPVHVSGSIMRLKNTVSHRIPGRNGNAGMRYRAFFKIQVLSCMAEADSI